MFVKNENVKLEIIRVAKGNMTPTTGPKCRDFNKKREDQYIKQYRNQFRKADGDYYNGVQTSRSKVDDQWMGPFEAKYESMKKSLLVFTEMGSINAGLAEFINYIAEHVSPRIAGRWDVHIGAWCNRCTCTECSRRFNESVRESLLFSVETCWTTYVL